MSDPRQCREEAELVLELARARIEIARLRKERDRQADELAEVHELLQGQYCKVENQEAEVARLRANQETLESALRGVQGIEFDDGYHVNVADLQAELARLREALKQR